MNITYSTTDILIWGIGIIILISLFVIQRKLSRVTRQYERLQHEFLVANNSAIGLGKQVLLLEKKVYELTSNPHVDQTNNSANVSSTTAPFTVVSNDIVSNMGKSASERSNNSSNNSTANNTSHKTAVRSAAFNEEIDINSAMRNDLTTAVDDAVYEKSRQLLAQGHDIEDVIKQSGLSYSEVSLMKALVQKG